MVLKSEMRIKEIKSKLAWLAQYVKFNNQDGMTDINKAVEDFFCGLLNIIFDASLENMNYVQRDYPAVDLGDEENRLAVQVTSTNSRDKIIHTLDKFFEHKLDKDYNRLVILIVGKKESYRKKFTVKRNFPFDKDRDIWDIDDLSKEISELEDDTQEAINQYLDQQMQYPWEETYRKAAAAAKSATEPETEPISADRKLRNSLPDTLGESFVGREAELEKLDQALKRRDNPIFITGLGGIGKTELAIRFCQERQDKFKVHFVRFAGTFKDTVITGIAGGVENLWLKDANRDYIYGSVMGVLKECDSNTILIIDNADPADGNFDSLKDDTYKELCRMDLRLIITTRANVSRGVEVRPMDVDRLLEIMHKHGQTRDAELVPLIEAVNRHTLTVDLMARTLDESWDEVTPAMLLEALRNSTLPEADYPEVTTDHNRDEGQLQIYAHLRSLFNVVQMDDDAKTALCCATLLPEGGMEASMFKQHLPAGAQKAAMTLDKRGFLRREKGMVSIHPVIRLVAYHELKPTDEICREFLENLWGKYDKKQYNHDLYSTMAEVYTMAAEKLENERGGWSGRARALWDKVGQYDSALECAKMTIERREASLPADHPDLADAYNDMGIAYAGLRDYHGMMTYYGKALEIRQRILPENHVDLARSYNNVGCVYQENGDNKKALAYKLQALSIFEKVLPDNDMDIATSCNHVGSVCYSLGEFFDALKYFERSLKICSQVLSDDHPNLAVTYSWLADAHRELGDFAKSLEYSQKALSIYEKVLPADHAEVANSYEQVGRAYGVMGEYHKELEYYEKTMRIRRRALPIDHPDLASSYHGMGCAFCRLQNYPKALEYIQMGLKIREKVLPTNHLDFGFSYIWMGFIYEQIGDYEKSLKYHEQTLELRKKMLPNDHPDIASVYENMGCAYGHFRNYSAAVENLEKALPIYEAKLPIGHPDIERTRSWLNKYRRKLENQHPSWKSQIH